MKEQKMIETAESFAGAVCENPFSGGEDIIVFRHGKGGKWFGVLLNALRRALGLEKEGCARVLNVKCEPLLAAVLCENYADIFPAYHMNKTHWISLSTEGNLPDREIENLLRLSYTLTLPKSRRKFD